MRKLKTSEVWCFMLLTVIGSTLIGISWGNFKPESKEVYGFALGNAIWTFFVLCTLFEFVHPKETK